MSNSLARKKDTTTETPAMTTLKRATCKTVLQIGYFRLPKYELDSSATALLDSLNALTLRFR